MVLENESPSIIFEAGDQADAVAVTVPLSLSIRTAQALNSGVSVIKS